MGKDGAGAPLATRPELQGTFGMVASTHWLASAAGMRMLEIGGNAFDAAAAAGFVLQVVQPHLNGPGGEVVLAISDCRAPHPEILCGQGAAPRAATVEHFRDLGIAVIPGTGTLAACVPGAFGAWITLLRDRGSVTLREVLDPAIGYAYSGFPASPGLAEAIEASEPLFRSAWTTSADTYLSAGRVFAGARVRNASIARTFRSILEQAEAASGDRRLQCDVALDSFYRGFVAESIDRFCSRGVSRDVMGTEQRALLAGDDLAGWVPSWETPVSFEFRGTTVLKAGPWSQGPVLLQQLAILANMDLESMPRRGSRFVHAVVEASKLAFADRDTWYGDPLDSEVPIGALLDADYGRTRSRLVEEGASVERRPGSPEGLVPAPATAEHGALVACATDPLVLHQDDSCEINVVDRFGNFVSAIPGGGLLQSSPVVPGLGFSLGTRLQAFELDPRHPNRLLPFKRPRTTLSPSLACRDGLPVAAFGTSGSDEQDQRSLQLFLDAFLYADSFQLATERPLFQGAHLRSSFHPRHVARPQVQVDACFGQEVLDELRARGHELRRSDPKRPVRRSLVGRGGGLLRAAAGPGGAEVYAVGR